MTWLQQRGSLQGTSETIVPHLGQLHPYCNRTRYNVRLSRVASVSAYTHRSRCLIRQTNRHAIIFRKGTSCDTASWISSKKVQLFLYQKDSRWLTPAMKYSVEIERQLFDSLYACFSGDTLSASLSDSDFQTTPKSSVQSFLASYLIGRSSLLFSSARCLSWYVFYCFLFALTLSSMTS